MTPPVPGLRGLARRLPPGPAEFVLPGLGALVVALLLFTGLRGSRRARRA